MHSKRDKDKEKKSDGSPAGTSETEKYQELEHKYKRALADYQNLIKQTARDKEEFCRYANENLLYGVLPVYDNLKASLEHAGDDVRTNGWLEGIHYVIRQFKEVLERSGVAEIEAAGKKFDHHTMEAAGEEMTEDESQDGLVAKTVKSGYTLNGRVVMPARVIVYKSKIKNQNEK